MFSFNLVRWLKTLFRSRVKTIVKRPRFRLCLETLEDRLAPAQFIWTGGDGSSTNWSTASNWLGNAAPSSTPTDLAQLIFDNRGASHLTSVNDLNGLLVNSIQISSVNSYDLGGNQITLGDPSLAGSGTILVGSGLTGERIGFNMQLAATNASQQFFTVHSGADLTLSGRLTGTTGSQLTKEGTGTLFLTNDNSGFVGPFNINNDAGIVNISHAKALGASSNLVTVGNNSQLQISNVGLANPIANSLRLFGPGVSSNGSLFNIAGANVWSGTIEMGSNTSINVGRSGVQSVTVTNGGTGYTAAGTPNVVFSSGGGSGAAAVANMDTNVVGVTIVAGGSGYAAGTLSFGGPGSGAAATYTVDGSGAINGVTITAGGTGYDLASLPTITINDPSAAGTNANLTAVLNKFVASVTVTNGGSGYSSAPGVSFVGGGGSGTFANAILSPSASLTVTGQISDLSAPFTLSKIGQGTLILTNANTYRGSTTVADGTLVIKNPLALGSVPSAGTSVVRNSTLGTIGTLQLEFDSTFAPTTTVGPEFWTLQDPSAAFHATNNPYIGFVVNDVPLTLNAGGFGGNGALRNFLGNNTWTGTVTLGSPAPVGANVSINVDLDPSNVQTRLFLTGVIQDVIAPNGPFNLTKIGQGDLVLAPTNQLTGGGTPNLYKGTTTISAGTVTLRDSQGLGPQTKRNQAGNTLPIVTVLNDASLNLESNVGHVDSATGTINRLEVASPLSIIGNGYNSLGALNSVSGINTYTQKFFTSPVQNAVSGMVGGSLTPGRTYWVVTAIDGYGESLASNERFFDVTVGTQTATISWPQVVGATGYRIYRTTTSATYGATSLVTTINNGATTSFNDTGTALLAGRPPVKFPIISLAGDASIGVVADPNQSATTDYFTNDYSLTINGGITDGATPRTLSKVGTGHLILPNANNQFFGNTIINEGWITIQDPAALGGPNLSVQEVQPLVTVNNNAALMLRPFAKGTSFIFSHNLSIAGVGISHPFEEINNQGAVENLAGVNTLASNILLRGLAGIGVEEVFDRSHLTLTGTQSQGVANLNFTGNPRGGAQQNIGPANGTGVDTGSTSGLLTISAKVHSIGDDLRIYLGNFAADPANARLIYDASNDFVSVAPTAVNRFGADITVNYTATSATIDVVDIFDSGPGPSGTGVNWLYEGLGPQAIAYAPVAGLFATWVTIVMNPGKTSGGITQWTYNASIVPSGSFGGILKLGSQRMDIEGPGTFKGGVDIREGVVRVENNTALGAPGNTGTTVGAGAALELATTVPDQNGGQAIGPAIWDTPLYLNGTGNAEFGAAPLTVLGHDNYWHGPIALNSQIAISFEGALANQPINTMTATSSILGGSGSIDVKTTTPGGNGLNAVQMIAFGPGATGGTFRLTFDDGVNPPQTTNTITFSTDPNLLINGPQGIVNRLNAVFGAGRFKVSLASPTIDIYPNSRLIVTGAITDSNNPTTAGSDLILEGGGSLVLSGNNTYRGTTFVNQGILTLLNGQSLGGIGIAGKQQLALTNPIVGTTQFTLTFPGIGTTTAITYQGTAADASAIQTQLRTLLGALNVSVVQANPGIFLITFSGTLAGTTTLLTAQVTSAAGTGAADIASAGGTFVADKAQLQLEGGITVSGEPLNIRGSGNNVESAVQTFKVGTTALVPTGTFSLNFNGQSTGALPFDATAGEIQAALQDLSTVKNVGGQVLVNVDTVFPGINEEQRVTFTGYSAGDTYQLYFDPLSGPNQLGFNLTPPITYTGNPFTEKNNIVAALGNLQTIGGLSVGGTISGIASAGVSAGAEFADFLFTGALADQDVPLAQAFTLSGTGNAVVSEFIKGATGFRTFTVKFQGAFDGLPQSNLTLGTSGVTGSTTLSTPTTTIIGGSANATPIQWFAVGPAPITNASVFDGGGGTLQTTTGRVTGLDVQANFADDLYISTADGGFWRTVDGGIHWTPVFDTVAGSIIFGGAVTIARTADSTVYFGTGEGNNSADSYYGSGVYSANTHADLATSSTRLLTNPDGSNPLAGKAINKIVVNPNNPLMIWVGVSDFATNGTPGNAGVWRYDGLNWLNMTTDFMMTSATYMDIAYDSTSNVLYAGYFELLFSDILRCTNPTAAVPPSFTQANIDAVIGVTPADIGYIKLAVSGPNGAYAAISDFFTDGLLAIVRTTNGGATWTLVADVALSNNNIPDYLAFQGSYASAIAASGNTVYVGGVDQGNGTNFILRSTNGGTAWTDISKDSTGFGPHANVHALSIDRNGNLVAGTDGGVWRRDTAAGTWANLNGDLNIANMNSVATQPGNSGVILGGTQGSGMALFNGSLGWAQVNPAVNIANVTDIHFVPTNPSSAYALANGTLYQSTNSGATWNSTGAGATSFAVDLVDPNRVLTVSGAGVRESTSAAGSFNSLSSPAGNLVAGAAYQGTFIADPFFPAVSDIGANSYAPDTIYIANNDNIFLTKDHGVTWTFRTGAVTGASNASPIVITSNNHGLVTGQKVIIAGVLGNTNANGLFTITFVNANQFSLNSSIGNAAYGGGGTWTLADRAPPLVPGTTIQDLQVDPANSNVLYVVTSGRVTSAGTGRVFKSIDSGRNWTDVSAGLPLSTATGSVLPAWKLVIDSRGGDLYLGTDEGVWKLTGQAGNWQRVGAGLPNVQVKDLDLNPSTNTLTAATYGRGVWQFFTDDNTFANAPTNPGALRSIAGNNSWTGPITLAGPTTIAANGSQALQNGLSAATLTLLGTISDAIPTTNNTLTKVGGGDVTLAGANTYAGVTDIQFGNVVVKNATALGGSAVAGVQALSIFATPAPTQKALSLVSGASTIPNGTTFYYQITAIGPQGESIASNEQSITTTAVNQQVVVSWNGVAGATGYRIYRSSAPGPFGGASLLTTINSAATVTYNDTGTAVSAGAPPILQFTLSFGSATTTAINYTGIAATDVAAITAALTPAFFTSAGFAGGTATVSQSAAGIFLITFGGSLTGVFQPMFTGAITSGFGSASVTNGGGTIVENGAALVLESSLFLEPVTLNADGIQPSYSGHYTGALRSLSNANTFTGNITLNTNSTIGVDSGSYLTINSASPITLTSAGHGLANGFQVMVAGVVGNTNANGTWTVTALDANRFALNNATGNAPYVSGGTWTLLSNITAASAPTAMADIVITSANHGLVTGNLATISGVLGNTAANGTFTVTRINNDTFSLNSTAGLTSGAYSGGGLWLRARAITGATNGNPITISSIGHGLADGEQITIIGVLGNTAANGPWTVNNVAADSFQLVGSDGTASGSYTAATGTWTRPTASGTITGSTNPIGITDNGLGYKLEKEGAGTLVLASPDTYGGNTIVNQGILNIQNSNALGVAGSTTTVRDGAQLQLQTSSTGAAVNVASEHLVLSGSGIAGSGALQNVAGNNTWGSAGVNITLTVVPGFAPITTPAGTVAFGVLGANDTLTIGSPIVEPILPAAAPTTGPLSMGLSKVGPGRLTLTQSDSYSGTTYVNEGSLRIQNSGALGTDSGNEVQRITTFDALGTSQFSLMFNGQTTGLLTFGLPDTGGATPTSSLENALAALPAIGSTANVDVVRQTITLTTPAGTQIGYAYTITFVGALAGKDQPLLVALPSGGIKINASRVAEGGISTLVVAGASLEVDGNPANLSVPASESLALNGNGNARSYAITAATQTGATVTATVASTAGLTTGETVIISGFTPAGYNGTFAVTVIDATQFSYTAPMGLAAVTTFGSALSQPGALHNITGNNIWAGPVTLQRSSSVGVDPTGQLTVTGMVKDPSPNPIPSPIPPADLTKVGTGTLVFPNANTYTGSTFINTGVVNIRNNNALGINTSSVQNVSVFGSSGTFTLSYNGTPTSALSFGATAAQVKAALDTAIGAVDSVTVTQLGNTYTVYFSGANVAAMAQPILTGTGTGSTTVIVTPIQLGAASGTVVNNGGALQLQGGISESSAKSVFLNGAGPFGAGALENVSGNNTIAATTPVILQSDSTLGSDTIGDTLTLPQQITDQHQVQTINLSSITGGTQFTLTFNGLATGGITYNSANTAGARAANAAAIQAALNGLATISLAGGVVSVPAPSSGTTYSITFGGRLVGVNWPAIVVTRSSGTTFPANRSMVFGGFDVDKVGPGIVQYTGAGGNLYTGLTHVIGGVLQLNKATGMDAVLGDLTVGNPGVAEVQTLTITGTAGTFGLNFNGQTTGNLAFDVPASGGTGPTASVQNALNALSTIGSVGGTATVTKSGNVYTITFGGTLLGANLPALILTGSVQANVATVVNGTATNNEVQSVTVTGTSGTFTLTYNGQPTVALPFNVPASGGTLPGDSMQNALNALTTIGGAGGAVTVSKLGNVYTVSFGGSLGNTDLNPLIAAVTPIGTIATLTNGGLFSSAGSAVVQLLQADEINNTSNVLVNGDGVLDLNGNAETLGTTLRIVDGQVKTGATTLTLLNSSALDMTGGTINPAPSTGVVDLRGNVTATSTFLAPATVAAGTLDLHGATRTFTVNDGPNGSDLVAVGVIADLIGSSGITKSGPGRLELDATNTYAGVTRIDQGDVQVDGSTGNVSLNGGSLSGIGTVGAVSMLSTGTVNPGDNGTANPIGPLSSGNVTWNSNTQFFVDLVHTTVGAPVAGVDNDLLNVTGSITLGNALLLGSPGAGIAVGDSFTIIQSTVQMNTPADVANSGAVPANALDRIIGTSPREAIPQDGTVYLNGQKFILHYNTDSVVLTRQLAVFTSFTMVVDFNASVYGQEVTYTVSATPENGASLATAAPLITFNLDGSLYTHQVFLNASGVATYSPQSQHGLVWAPGVNHTIAATFTDANQVFQSPVTPSGSPITQVVNKNTVNVVLSSVPVVGPNVPVYGQPVDVIATITPVVTPNVPGASNPTGNVKFVVDSLTPDYIPINPYAPPPASQTSTLNIPGSILLIPGAHNVAVSYAGTPSAYTGDANYAASATVNFNLDVKSDQSVVKFLPAPTPSNLGQAATFNIQVDPALAGSSGQPVGTINIYDGPSTGTPLNATPIAYSGGTLVFNTTSLALGAHTITAKFTSGNTNYTGSEQNIAFNVNPATTATTILSNFTPASPTYGQAVQFNMQVVPNPAINASFGLPTGTITLWDGPPNTGINLGTGSITTSSGMATVTTLATALSQGNHTLNAVYSGDGQFGQSIGTLNLFIPGAAANTTVTANANPAIYTNPIILTATVTSPVPTPPTGPGTYAIFWDGAVGASTGTTATFVIPAVGNSVAVNVDSTTGFTNGETVRVTDGTRTITATITINSGTNLSLQTLAILAGSVGQIMANNAAVANTTIGASVMTGAGTAAITLPAGSLLAGPHSIRASYLDLVDTNYTNGTNTALSLPVNNAPTSVSVLTPTWGTSPTNPVFGQPVTLNARVLGPTANNPVTFGVAGSRVTFWDGPVGTGINLGFGMVVDNLGNASFTTTALRAGTHTINAVYTDTADAFFLTSQTGNTALTGALVGFTIDVSPTEITSLVSSTGTNPGALGTQITYTATVKTQAPSNVAPVVNGSVTFLDNGNPMTGSPVTVNATTGVASINVTYTTVAQTGNHVITATYNPPTTGTINYAASAPVQLTQNVLRASTVNVSAVSNSYGQNLIYNVTMTTNPTGGTPTGVIVVTENGNPVTYTGGTLSGGATTITIPGAFLIQGTHPLLFTYTDTSVIPVYAPSMKLISQVVSPAATAVVFSPLPQTNIVLGNTVTYEGNVTATAVGGMNPTAGTVKLFLDSTGSTAFATQTVSLTNEVQNLTIGGGAGTFTVTFNGFTTVSLPFNVAASGGTMPVDSLQNALNALPSIGGIGGTVSVTGSGTYSILFGGSLAGVNVPAMTAVGAGGATVSSPASTSPEGRASFSFVGVSLPANTPTGTHTVFATFTPANTNHSASQASSPLTIAQAPTTTAITSSSPVLVPGNVTTPTTFQSNFGQAITFSATVTSLTNGVPDTGTTAYTNAVSGVPLTFYISSNGLYWNGFVRVFGTVTRSNNGTDSTTYSITTSSLPALTTGNGYQVQAYFLGNSNFAATPVPQIPAQVSAVLYQKVAPAVTTVAPVTSSLPGGSFVGQPVTFTAVVTAASGGTPATSNGYMLFYANGTSPANLLGFGTLVSTTATTATYRFTASNLAINTPAGHQISARYVTDNPNFAFSAFSTAISQVVNAAQTATVLTSSPTVWGNDLPTTFTAAVSYAQGHGGSLVAGGSVTFLDNGNPMPGSPVTVPAGLFATFITYTVTTTLSSGAHTITATYSSTNPNIAGSSDSKFQADVKKYSNLSLVSSLVNPTVNFPVTYTATLTGATGPLAGKTVTFSINGTLYPVTTNASGVASVTGSFFSAAGTYPITATFTDSLFNDAMASLTSVVTTSGRLQ